MLAIAEIAIAPRGIAKVIVVLPFIAGWRYFHGVRVSLLI